MSTALEDCLSCSWLDKTCPWRTFSACLTLANDASQYCTKTPGKVRVIDRLVKISHSSKRENVYRRTHSCISY